jgi:Rrf2 family iron-sulfur cluster assembly transcriptional regulator
MQLTKRSSYGLIVIVELAAGRTSQPITAKTIARKYRFPLPFIEKILHQLRKSGLVTSRKGRGGGYVLALDPQTTSVFHILEALEEPLDLVGCLRSGGACRAVALCPTKAMWETIDRRLKTLLGSLTLADLLEHTDPASSPILDEKQLTEPGKIPYGSSLSSFE